MMTRIICLIGVLLITACGAPKPATKLAVDKTICQNNPSDCLANAQKLAGTESPDWEKAAEMYRLVCEKQVSDGCLQLGILHAERRLKRSSRETASHMYRIACDLKNVRGCSLLAESLLLENTIGAMSRAVPWLARACGMEDANSCYTLAELVEQGHGIGPVLGTAEALRKKAMHLWQASCNNGNRTDCRYEKEKFNKSSVNSDDPHSTIAILTNACENLNGKSCLLLGNAYAIGRGTAVDDDQAADMYFRACELNSGEGCTALAIQQMEEHHTVDALPDALPLLQKACNLLNAYGCYLLGEAFSGDKASREDLTKGFVNFELACHYGYPGGCLEMGKMFLSGKGVEKDLVKAMDVFSSTCNGSFNCDTNACASSIGDTCNQAGLIYSENNGEPQSLQVATRFFRRGCELDSVDACKNLKRLNSPSPKKASPRQAMLKLAASALPSDFLQDIQSTVPGPHFLSRKRRSPGFIRPYVNCEFERGDACFAYGFSLTSEEGQRVDEPQVFKYFQLSCEYGSAPGCYQTARYLQAGRGVNQNIGGAYQRYQKACRLGYSAGCGELANMLANGISTPPDVASARKLFIKACSAKDMYSCANLAILNIQEGKYTKAGSLLKQACTGGAEPACIRLAYLMATGCLDSAASCDTSMLQSNVDDNTDSLPIAMENAKTKCAQGEKPELCVVYGLYLLSGDAGKNTLDSAVPYFENACQKSGNPWGCFHFGVSKLSSDTNADLQEEAFDLFTAGCNDGFALSCVAAAQLIFKQNAGRNEAKAMKLLANACGLGSTEACMEILFACESGIPSACKTTIGKEQ